MPSFTRLERADKNVAVDLLPWVKAIGKVIEDSRRKVLGAPFPFRDAEGNIIFPVRGGVGTFYKEEYLAGL